MWNYTFNPLWEVPVEEGVALLTLQEQLGNAQYPNMDILFAMGMEVDTEKLYYHESLTSIVNWIETWEFKTICRYAVNCLNTGGVVRRKYMWSRLVDLYRDAHRKPYTPAPKGKELRKAKRVAKLNK